MALTPLMARRAAMILLGAAILVSCNRPSPSVDAPDQPASQMEIANIPPPPDGPVTAVPGPVASTTAPNYLSQQQPIIRDQPQAEKPRQVGIYTPPRGSAERVALMNALRAQVRGEMGGDVIFVVTSLHSNGEWAFGQLEPTWPDGRAIRVEGTPAYRESPHLDGLRTEAIWRKTRGRWTIFAHAVGATDVWWLEHCRAVPQGVMAGCG